MNASMNIYAGINGDSFLRISASIEPQEQHYDEREVYEIDDGSGRHIGWPGDGSGEDDFADYNANEAMDYCNE